MGHRSPLKLRDIYLDIANSYDKTLSGYCQYQDLYYSMNRQMVSECLVMKMWAYVWVSMYVCEGERDRERETERLSHPIDYTCTRSCVWACVCVRVCVRVRVCVCVCVCEMCTFNINIISLPLSLWLFLSGCLPDCLDCLSVCLSLSSLSLSSLSLSLSPPPPLPDVCACVCVFACVCVWMCACLCACILCTMVLICDMWHMIRMLSASKNSGGSYVLSLKHTLTCAHDQSKEFVCSCFCLTVQYAWRFAASDVAMFVSQDRPNRDVNYESSSPMLEWLWNRQQSMFPPSCCLFMSVCVSFSVCLSASLSSLSVSLSLSVQVHL